MGITRGTIRIRYIFTSVHISSWRRIGEPMDRENGKTSDSSPRTELAKRLAGKVTLSSDVSDADIAGIEFETLVAKILGHFEGTEGFRLLDKALLFQIKEMKEEKSPDRIESPKVPQEAAPAKDIESRFSIRNADEMQTKGDVADFTAYFNDRLEKLREFFGNARGASLGSMLNRIEGVRQYANGREVSVVGMVYDKIVTKNGHVMATLEDETGSVKVLFIRPQKEGGREASVLFDSATRIVTDEVLAVRGKISGPFIIANLILWPDVPIRLRKTTEDDIAMAFISDIHVGSKLFRERQFSRFISWLNGGISHRKDLAGKVKYIVASGDLVDGIGVYPNQDKELSIPDIYKQYAVLFDFMDKIPDHIEVFLLPGNHDAVRLAEPQPPLTDDLLHDFKKDNIHFVSNPGFMTLHGLKVLGYHGTSLDSIIQAIPGCSYSKPEIAMAEVLKRRHLTPVYGDNPIVPGKKDPLIISEIPDIMHMGHVHRNGNADYHGTLILNSGTWQSKTPYQVKLGHMPTPALLQVYETKSARLSEVDFNFAEDAQ